MESGGLAVRTKKHVHCCWGATAITQIRDKERVGEVAEDEENEDPVSQQTYIGEGMKQIRSKKERKKKRREKERGRSKEKRKKKKEM